MGDHGLMYGDDARNYDEPAQNTDKEIWRRIPGDYYSPSILVTIDGNIGINCGGEVVVQSVEKWHQLWKDANPDAFKSELK